MDECRDDCQRPKLVHLTKIQQGEKVEEYLCAECPKLKTQEFLAQTSVKSFLKGASPVAGPADASKTPVPVGESDPPSPTSGMTWADFQRTGRLGAPEDYEFFRKRLLPLLEKIHGHAEHRGRIPTRVARTMETDDLVAYYTKQLEEAVAREEYERAATFRDKIRALR